LDSLDIGPRHGPGARPDGGDGAGASTSRQPVDKPHRRYTPDVARRIVVTIGGHAHLVARLVPHRLAGALVARRDTRAARLRRRRSGAGPGNPPATPAVRHGRTGRGSADVGMARTTGHVPRPQGPG